MHTHYICTGSLSQTAYIYINKDEFESIKTSHSTLLSISEIEEKYNLIISAYADLEKEIHNTNIEYFLQGSSLFDQNHFSARERLNLKIMSFLTSVKLFQDRVPNWLSKISTESEETFCKKRSQLFDENLDYRFIEKFRNYAQHYQTPIDNIQYKEEWVNNRETLKYTIKIESHRGKLSKTKGFFSKVLLKELDEKIDLLKFIRGYVAHISTLVIFSRSELETQYNDSSRSFKKYINEYRSSYGNPIGLKACRYLKSEGKNCEEMNITERLINYIETARHQRKISPQLKKIEISI